MLGAIGTLWCTVYAYLEYYSERMDDLDRLLETIVWQDVYYQYVRPKLLDKMYAWCQRTNPSDPTPDHAPDGTQNGRERFLVFVWRRNQNRRSVWSSLSTCGSPCCWIRRKWGCLWI